MLWRGQRESSNVEDGRGAGGLVAGGGIGSIVIGLIVYLLGGSSNPFQNVQGPQQQQQTQTATNDDAKRFVSVILGYTEDVWTEQFKNMGREYQAPTLHLFSNSVQSACGTASQASGPFYCPGDQKVYLDMSFFEELQQRFGAGGEFADAYVIAHEVGHHVQKLLGISDKVDAMRGQLSETEMNKLSVKLELQADFLAGMWAHYQNEKKTSDMQSIIQEGDIDQALNAANAIGDDRLQKQSQGYVVPDAFTHGSSAQRIKWFRKGFETGDLKQGDTFNTTDL
ncbi:MAG: metalloprotease [Chitinophagaceae bacterium]|nr:metalloprotease [Chitinophagaceae bacterium]